MGAATLTSGKEGVVGKAIIAAGALVALAIVAVNLHTTVGTPSGVFRVNNLTGQMDWCRVRQINRQSVFGCWPAKGPIRD